MTLGSEWSQRIEFWIQRMQSMRLTAIGDITVEGFTTMDMLSFEQASAGSFKPMPVGSRWGRNWEYAWFRAKVSMPESAAGRRVVLMGKTGVEARVAVDGVAVESMTVGDRYPTISMQAVAGAEHVILFEAYAGHQRPDVSPGPVLHGQQPSGYPDPDHTVPQFKLAIWEEAIYQAYIDLQTLYYLRMKLDPDSLRVAEIDAGLKRFVSVVDVELPLDEMIAGCQAGRAVLKPLLACVNGSTSPRFYCFGHAHIDTAWLWPIQETHRKIERTAANQLQLMDEYPNYKFLCSQPEQYLWLKEQNPNLYERVRAAVKRGQWIAEGGMWVEADTNIAGGEGLIRQFVWGKRFFSDEFGVESELLWLPDVFGYSGAMPQILAGCGIRFFSTAKIFWAYHDADRFPYNTFEWEGIDGTRILSHFCRGYNEVNRPDILIERWNKRAQKDGMAERLHCFGWGDGGGGPDRDHLELLMRLKDLEGAPRAEPAAPHALFEDLLQADRDLPRYVGELYFQAHRGTYTSQAKTKRGNRKSELALREAEFWAMAARACDDFEIPRESLARAWRIVLVNHFHDILPGSSIQRVHEEAEVSYSQAIGLAEDVIADALSRLTEDKPALTVFNSLSWPRQELVELPVGVTMAQDAQGNALPVQKIGDTTWAEVSVPACGWTTVSPTSMTTHIDRVIKAEPQLLENDLLRLEFDRFGRIVRMLDKATGCELAHGPCNEMRMFKDVPAQFDAWDIDRTYTSTPVPLEAEARLTVETCGELDAVLRIERPLHHSMMIQRVRIRRGKRRVDFETEIDWNERHKLLKVAFDVDYYANEALHEIQFGHVARPNHASRPFDADRFEVPQHKWTALVESGRGFGVLNDCKYGVDVKDKTISLTLLKSAMAPDENADIGRQRMTWAMYFWEGSFESSGLVQEAYELNVPVRTAGGVGGHRSLIVLDQPNVILETVKPAEDGSDDLVLRLYHSQRGRTSCTLQLDLPVIQVTETDMLEQAGTRLKLDGRSVSLAFGPFEIKTLRVRMS